MGSGHSESGNPLGGINSALGKLVHLAESLAAGDTENHVRRSVEELRAAFEGRAAIEPAVARVVRSVRMLASASHAGTRRNFSSRAPAAARVDEALAALLPELRRMGFDV